MPRTKGNRVHADLYVDPAKYEQLQRLSEGSRVPMAVYLREAVDDLLRKRGAPWNALIPGCFGLMDANFALHPLDKERAKNAIRVAKASGASFEDFEKELVWHCHREAPAWRSKHTTKQVARARKLWGKPKS